jgi:hypothetical protein
MAFQRLLWAVFATALFLSPARAAYDVGDIICETSTTTGTGTLNLAGAVTNYATFVSQITSGSSVNYHITASDGTLETGVGVLTDAGTDTLTRVAYWSTDGSGAELTLPAGTHTVCLGPTTQMFAGMKGFQLYTDDAGAVGGILPFWHDSASAVDGDIAADIQVWAGADDEEVARIALEVDDGATTTEDTRWRLFNDVAGTSVQTMVTSGLGAIIGAGTTLPGNDGDLRLYNADDSTAGPQLEIHHDDPSSDAGDDAGRIDIYGGADDEQIGSITLDILDPATTTEDTSWIFTNRIAGADVTALTLSAGADPLGTTLGEAHTFNWGSANFPTLILQNSSADDGGPSLLMYQDSTTPAAVDQVAGIYGYGEDNAGNIQQYFRISARIVDATSTGEDSVADFRLQQAGANAVSLQLGDTGFIRFYEAAANGAEYKAFITAAANTATTTCTFENDANFVPDSCVGDGSDASDGRLKTDLKPAGDVGGLLDSIKIYDYAWTADAPEASEAVRKGKRGFGPVAQELFNVNADFVGIGGDDPIKDPWTWKPEKVVPYLIVEVQNLRKRLANQACYGIKLGSACIGVSM